MSRPTQARRQAARPDFAYGALTRSGRPSQTVRLSSRHRRLPRRRPSTPRSSPHAVWAPPRSLAATGGISFDFFSCGYLDGSLPRVSPQLVTSFFAWRLLGILRGPYSRLTILLFSFSLAL